MLPCGVAGRNKWVNVGDLSPAALRAGVWGVCVGPGCSCSLRMAPCCSIKVGCFLLSPLQQRLKAGSNHEGSLHNHANLTRFRVSHS